MTVDMRVFQGFAEQIKTLGSHAQPTDMPDEEPVRLAKAVFLAKLDTVNAVDLESCVRCGLCAQACHFQVGTGNPKYVPARKMGLAQRVYRRELSPMRWLYRLYTRDITAQDLRDFQELVYDSYTECGRCGVVCPMGINIASIVNTSRQALARAGLIPDDLRAVGQEQCMRGTVFGAGPDMLRQVLDELRTEGLDTPLDKDKAEVLVLTLTVDLQLFKDQLRSTIRILNYLGEDWTVRSCAFEGENFGLLSGYEPLQGHASNTVVRGACDRGQAGHRPGMRSRLPGAALGGGQSVRPAPALRGHGDLRVLGAPSHGRQAQAQAPPAWPPGHLPRSLQGQPGRRGARGTARGA
jgi:heterodisulfide reductase subunit C